MKHHHGSLTLPNTSIVVWFKQSMAFVVWTKSRRYVSALVKKPVKLLVLFHSVARGAGGQFQVDNAGNGS